MSTDDLEPRVRALEERMEIQESLRAAQDDDLGVVDQRTRAIRGPLQALSVTVSEHTVRLGRIERTVSEHTVRLGRIERTLRNTHEVLAEHVVATAASFARMDERFQQVDERFQQVDRRFDEQGELLSRIAAKVDRLAPDES